MDRLMLNGDISNSVEPRMLVVFEGLIARPQSGPKRVYRSFGRQAGKTRRAIKDLETNLKVVAVINDVVWRYKYTVDVLTFMPDEFLPHIEEYIDDLGLPYGRLVQADKYRLARELSYRRDVVGVFFPDPRDVLVFGSKGYRVDPDDPRMVGLF